MKQMIFFLILVLTNRGYSASISCFGWSKSDTGSADTFFSQEIDITEDIKNDPELFKKYAILNFSDFSVEFEVSTFGPSITVNKASGSFSVLGKKGNPLSVRTSDGLPKYLSCSYKD